MNVLLLLVGLVIAQSAHANLVTNSSFESGALGWTFSDGNPDTGGNGRDVGTCASPCTIASSGSWAGFKNLFDGGSGTISQTIATVPGRRYLVQTGLAGNNYQAGTVFVSFGSTTGATASGTDVSTTYRTYQFEHVAIGTHTSLVFGGTVTAGTFFIDDVSVTEITSAMAISGPKRTWVNQRPTRKLPNPEFILTAALPAGTPTGGTFAWSSAALQVNAGSVEPIRVNADGSSATFRGLQPSNNPDDVEIRVDYSVNGTTMFATRAFSVLRPASLCTCNAGVSPWVCGGAFDQFGRTVTRAQNPALELPYKTQYVYTALDQFKQRFDPRSADFMANTPDPQVTEVLSKLQTSSKCDRFAELGVLGQLFFGAKRTLSATSQSGVVVDEIGLRCTEPLNPPETLWTWNQDVYLADWLVSRRVLTFFADRAVSQSDPSAGLLCPISSFDEPRPVIPLPSQ